MRRSRCKCCLCMFSGCFAEYWSVIGQFPGYFFRGSSVIGRDDNGARFGSVLGKT